MKCIVDYKHKITGEMIRLDISGATSKIDAIHKAERKIERLYNNHKEYARFAVCQLNDGYKTGTY